MIYQRKPLEKILPYLARRIFGWSSFKIVSDSYSFHQKYIAAKVKNYLKTSITSTFVDIW